jgi:predicted ester cyclase
MIGEGDYVAFRYTIEGTHQGEFMGVAPTGKRVSVTAMEMLRFADGKMVDRWGNTDQLGILQQIGALPPMG